MNPKIALINDTSTFNNHFGCQLVGQTMREQFARVGLELTLTLGLRFKLNSEIEKKLAAADLVIINGEGSIHHSRNIDLLQLAKKYPCVLINTAYDQNPHCEALHSFLYISTRESLSAKEITKVREQCEVVPDAIFASSLLNSLLFPSPVDDIGYTDNVTNKEVGFRPKTKLVTDYLEEISKYQRLCIGRFHAVVVAMIMNKPFSTWDSNTHKTRGMMADIGIPQLHFDTFDEAKNNVPSIFPKEASEFKNTAKQRIELMFDHIGEIARNR